ncbi:MAG: hypothetical protein QOE56_2499 [Solirubrobacterales bacterium]|jgi:hypothetical protein|nr:hypothetical protein [Solirubrobacterales bacterium]
MRRLQAKYPALARNAPVLLMGLAALASVVALLAMQSGLTFFQDEWNMVIHRQGFNADAFFLPNDVHPVPLPVAIYKLCLEVFGLTTVGPDRVIAVLLYAATAVLLFAYARKRLGGWLALFPAVLLLFLGPGWNVLLWPFEMTLVGSLAAGLATLLALERDDRRGDVLACFLLVVSMACSSLGISFALAAAVDVLIKRRRRGLWRLYVPALALVLYVVWYLTYGHKVPSALSFSNVVAAPLYVAEGVSSSLSSLVGLNAATPSAEAFAHPNWDPPLLVATVVLIALWLRRPRPISSQILVVATAALSFWVLGGFNFIPGREPTASRYQYIGVVFIVLILAELFRGVRLSGRAIMIVAGIAAIALVSNLLPLKDGLATVEQQSELARGELAAIEIARDSVEPAFALTPEIAATATLTPIDAGSYLAAVDEHGSPAAPLAELPSLSPGVRKQIDVVLVNALPVELLLEAEDLARRSSGLPPQTENPPGVRTQGSCLEVSPGAAAEGLGMTLQGSTSVRVDPGPKPELGIWRYGEEPALENPLEAGSTSLLRIPADRSTAPWHALLTGEQAMAVCTTGGDLGSSG